MSDLRRNSGAIAWCHRRSVRRSVCPSRCRDRHGTAGAAAAIEAARVALLRDDWCLVPEAIEIGRWAFATIQQNLWFTGAYNVIGVRGALLGAPLERIMAEAAR